jgi:hypothetical protein
MSDIALIVNGVLGVLLLCALFVGWRLEGRLKALKASHASFAQAVGDLDRAAARAEQGLADLRAATDEAAEVLAGRIERAGALSAKLERLTVEATETEARLIVTPRAAAAPAGRDAVLTRFAERFGAEKKAPAPPARPRADLILEEEPAAPPSQAARLARLRELAEPRAAARPSPRARLDDDLFEAPAPRRASGGAR